MVRLLAEAVCMTSPRWEAHLDQLHFHPIGTAAAATSPRISHLHVIWIVRSIFRRKRSDHIREDPGSTGLAGSGFSTISRGGTNGFHGPQPRRIPMRNRRRRRRNATSDWKEPLDLTSWLQAVNQHCGPCGAFDACPPQTPYGRIYASTRTRLAVTMGIIHPSPA
jgi:hypothetical protein